MDHHAGELFPRVSFIVTNLTLPSRAVVRFYNKRGTSEQWIKQGKQAVKMTRLSCHRFRSNEVRLVAERDRLQPWESVAAAGAAAAGWKLVTDKPTTAAGEDRRSPRETRSLLLVAAGQEPSDAPALQSHAEQDRSIAFARRLGEPTT